MRKGKSATAKPTGFASSLKTIFLATAALAASAQANNYTVTAAAANLTNIAVDGKCNLTEAIQSMMQGPVNSDCVQQSASTRKVILSGANTVFQVAANTTIWSDMTLTTSDAGVTVEAAGTPLKVLDGCAVYITGPSGGMTIRVKSGSAGRALWNGGDVIGTKVTFQGGNVSGLSGDANGGVVFNQGNLNLTDCTLQNGTAVNGGGLYNTTPWCALTHVIIQNNTATQHGGGAYNETPSSVLATSDIIDAKRCAIQNNTAAKRGGGVYNNGWLKLTNSAVAGNKAGQGGGIFHQKPVNGQQPELTMESSTLADNKSLASELTPVPAASGGSISSSGTVCSQSESANQGFDGDFATKWCTTPASGQPAELTYMFPSPVVVSAYSLTSANDVPARDPKNWVLQGWNGSSWVTLHTITNFSFTGSVSSQRYLTESFNSDLNTDFPKYFNNTTAYSGYKLKVTANGGNAITQLAEVQFFPQGQTGDGGGLYTIGHMNVRNSTLSGNIAGCTSTGCACTAAFCASASNTTAALGKGGGLYAGDPPPEAFFNFVTVAGNSASQGGGVYADHNDHWGWCWSLIGKNSSRATRNPEPDFHGAPHAFFTWHEILVQNTAGTTGLSIGSNADISADPLLNALADNGGEFSDLHPWTHALQAGSPAIDRAISQSEETKDERGVARPQGAYKDMGAVERQ